ncbi:MAG TPA: hypothetical protein VEU62_13835 [Bryobacterales bacterium]|nr:hypothetical protein [Bryobacterales bacterium]
MLSHRLVRIVEGRSEAIVEPVVREIRANPEFKHMQKSPVAELREWGCGVLNDLGNWLIAGKDAALASRYEGLGRLRFKESVPLHEVVHALHLLKSGTIDYVRDQGFSQTPVEIFAEEELEYLLGHFFDWLEEHLVHGYETALRKAAHLAS